jgi:hypothetical protein
MSDGQDALLDRLARIEKLLLRDQSWGWTILKIVEKVALPLVLGILVFIAQNAANKISKLQEERQGREFVSSLQLKYLA